MLLNHPQNSDYTADFDYYGDGELSSDEYSYLYYQDYYDELVPKHHRFDANNNQSSHADAANSGNSNVSRKNKSIKSNSNNNNNNNNGDGSFNVFVVRGCRKFKAQFMSVWCITVFTGSCYQSTG